MPSRLRSFLVRLAMAAACSGAHAASTVSIPATTAVRLEAFVYEPAGAGPHPVVVFNHGSSGGNPKASLRARRQAEYFTSRGFLVVVPMRRGRGGSSGTSLESEDKNCDTGSWAPGLQSAFEDITATLAYLQTLKGADPARVLLAGTSRGGFLSAAYAASGEKRGAVAGVVNFVGGWVAQAEDQCPTDFNQLGFAEFGSRTSVPSLWLYGENDAFYSADSIRSYVEAFRSSGGQVRFHLVKGVPRNGHWLADHPALWMPLVDSYLQSLGLWPHGR